MDERQPSDTRVDSTAQDRRFHQADKANFLVTVRDALDRADEGVVKVDEHLYAASLEAAVRSADENHTVSLNRLFHHFDLQLTDDAAPEML
eukprot:2147585-Pleurochrysis_carterae.AAC.1